MWGNGTISLSVRVGNTVFSFLQSDGEGEMDVVGEFGDGQGRYHADVETSWFFFLFVGERKKGKFLVSYCV